MDVNGWKLNFEYETENGVLAKKIIVNGAKGNTSIFVSKINEQVQTIFSNGGYDSEVVNVIVAEFSAIDAEYVEVPAVS